MKSGIISGILLSVLAAYLVLPVIPIVDFLINREYIAKNLCINRDKPKSCCKGKCHLVKQLKKNSTNTENENKDRGKSAQYKQLDEFLVNKSCQPIIHKTASDYLTINSSKLQQLSIAAIFVPPKYASHPLSKLIVSDLLTHASASVLPDIHV
jgi:hypothetical protein